MSEYLRMRVNFVLVVLLASAGGQPTRRADAEAYLDKFLDLYLGEIESDAPEDDIYETMQGDQPAGGNAVGQSGGSGGNFTQYEYLMAQRNSDEEARSRENRIKVVKDTIFQYLGKNSSTSPFGGNNGIGGTSQLNMSVLFPNFFNYNASGDDEITEKMRSFYPSCDIPANTDQELWKDDEIMNLFFNFDYMLDSKTANVASATMRLYRLPKNGTKFNSPTNPDCDISNDTEDDRLLRVSVYRYTKPLKRRRTKRVLSDSKVISENTEWVELNIKHAVKAWTKSRNLGLGILVEDQEGNSLRADKYFKGVSCTVGTSTPKPIPTVVLDAARRSHELDRLRGAANSTSALRDDVFLLPTIDICVVELSANGSASPVDWNFRMNACNLKRTFEHKRLAEGQQLERVALLSDLVEPSTRRVRHRRQHSRYEGGRNSTDSGSFSMVKR